MNPDLLLMDEPLSNLDTELRVEMRREIKELHQKTKVTVVYVTHDQSEALALADRIVVMNQGQIEQVGTPQEIYSHPATPFVAKFVGRSNLIAGTWSADTFTLPALQPAGRGARWLRCSARAATILSSRSTCKVKREWPGRRPCVCL